MNVLYAARFTTVVVLGAALYTWLQMRPGLATSGASAERQAWLALHGSVWTLGWWLWLVAIFSWMWLLIALAWSYLPAHRMAAMLQSGLMIIAAVLAIAGVTVWMAVLPLSVQMGGTTTNTGENLAPLVDMLAMSLVSAGCFMGGLVTSWIAWDLIRQKVLRRFWLWLLVLAGLALAPAPFTALHPYPLAAALGCWLLCTLWLSTRERLPSPFSEWPAATLEFQ
jgi:hypothetical protein